MKESNIAWDRPVNRRRGLYVHFPFCVKKCNYCAFLSFPADEDLRRRYARALMKEIELAGGAGDPARIDTVYFGGGTPSVMDVSLMSQIMKTIRRHFDVSPDAEITIEANPGTIGIKDRVVRAKLTAYKYMGINRLSMGVQSMNNDRLAFLGRIHTAEDVVRDVSIARELGYDNINLDLIFSVPGESAEDALGDARRLLELGPEHISCYSLQLEEGTPFYEMAERGELSETEDEDDRNTYRRICDLLAESGYEHYEISNFGRKTGEGRLLNGDEVSPLRASHNSLYWDMSDYIGLGLGASGYVDGVRYRNTQDMEEYLSILESREACSDEAGAVIGRLHAEEHRNTAFDNISEAVFTGLRRREGIRYEDAIRVYHRPADHETDDPAAEFWDVFRDARAEAEEYSRQGLLIIDEEGLRLTRQGIDISNQVMSLFV